MKSMSYGTLPSYREFQEAFIENVEHGRYVITAPNVRVEGNDFSYFAATYTSASLYHLVKDQTHRFNAGEIDYDSQEMQQISGIMHSLGFEWIMKNAKPISHDIFDELVQKTPGLVKEDKERRLLKKLLPQVVEDNGWSPSIMEWAASMMKKIDASLSAKEPEGFR